MKERNIPDQRAHEDGLTEEMMLSQAAQWAAERRAAVAKMNEAAPAPKPEFAIDSKEKALALLGLYGVQLPEGALTPAVSASPEAASAEAVHIPVQQTGEAERIPVAVGELHQ